MAQHRTTFVVDVEVTRTVEICPIPFAKHRYIGSSRYEGPHIGIPSSIVLKCWNCGDRGYKAYYPESRYIEWGHDRLIKYTLCVGL